MPLAVGAHCQVEMDGAAYFIGGGDGSRYNSVYKLEHGAAEWVEVGSMNQGRTEHSCAVLNSRIYVMGGAGNPPNSVEVYDPASDTWTYGPVLPTTKAQYAQAIAYGGTVYFIGGYDNTDVYSYTPGPGAEWETLSGVNIPSDQDSYRPVFPAPVVSTDTMYCVTSG